MAEEVAPDPLAARIAAADLGEAPPAPAGTAAPGEPAGAPAVVDESQLWIEAAVHYGAMARAMLPAHVQPHWTEERLRAVGVELARCAAHFGWKWGGALNHPLAKLAVVAFPLAWPLAEPYVMPYLRGSMGGVPKAPEPAAEAGRAPAGPGPVPVPPIGE